MSIPANRTVIFIPDRNLARWAVGKTGRKNVVIYDGFCPTHMRILPEMVEAAKKAHPKAVFIAHPECRREVLDMADAVASTSGMLKFARETPAKEIIVGTESGMLYALKRAAPDKQYYPAAPEPVSTCSNMKLITLEKILWSLEETAPHVDVPDDLAEKAIAPIKRMLEIRGG